MSSHSTTKYCPRCEQERTIAEFYRSHSYCKICHRDYKREHRGLVVSKQCAQCGEVRDRTEFRRSKRFSDGLHTICVPCLIARSSEREPISLNKKKARKKYQKHQKRNAQIIQEYKASHPCSICGEARPPCLDFHHRAGTQKLHDISAMASYAYSPQTVLAEIEKCAVVCANCHRLIHAGVVSEDSLGIAP